MATEYHVADITELPEGARRIVNVNGREIGVFNVGGRYYALPNVCFHQGGRLCEGKITGTLIATAESGWKRQWVKEGEILRCPWHSMEFDITTGECLAFPGRRIRTYEVKVEAGKVLLIA